MSPAVLDIPALECQECLGRLAYPAHQLVQKFQSSHLLGSPKVTRSRLPPVPISQSQTTCRTNITKQLP